MKTLFVVLAVAVCFSAYAATDVRSGAWTAEVDGDSLQMSVFPRSNDHDHARFGGNVMGFDEPIASFRGLSKDDVAASAANVRFEMDRPAGTIVFEGRFADGTAAGHFRFTPDDAFLRDMDTLGYHGFSDEQLLMFAVNDFSPQTIRDLRAMGYQLTIRELDEIAAFRITAELIRDYARLGYPNLTMREVVNFRVGRVDADYINGMRALGYPNLSAHELAESAILGVRPAYVRELQTAGLTGLSAKELRDLRIGRITAARIEEYRKLGYDHLTAKQLINMGIFGVTPEYIRSLIR